MDNIKKDNISVKSLNSIGSHKERKQDSIPFRIDFIKELLNGKGIKSLIDFDETGTEYFTGKVGDGELSNDTRYVLNKKLYNFHDIINQIGGKLTYIKSGTSGHTFKGMVAEQGININYAVKVVAYPKKSKYGDMNNIKRPENAELMMIKLLGYFVVMRQSPHIVLPIVTFNTSIKPFVNLIETGHVKNDKKKYTEFVEKYNKDYYYDHVSILISEWANKGDLLEFFRNYYKQFQLIHWQVFFFQLISVLAIIQDKYPTFRHNDLKANNILVHKVEKKRSKKLSYTICGYKYVLPSIGYIIKLWDFDFACIPGIVDNAKVNAEWTNEINVKPEQNRYYDLHYFFNTLIKKGFFPQLMEDPEISPEVKQFILRIVPKPYQVSKKYVTPRGRFLDKKEFCTPDEVLKNDPFFKQFRKGKIKKNKTRQIKLTPLEKK